MPRSSHRPQKLIRRTRGYSVAGWELLRIELRDAYCARTSPHYWIEDVTFGRREFADPSDFRATDPDEGQEPFTCRNPKEVNPEFPRCSGTQRNEESQQYFQSPPVTTGWGGRHATLI